jgi:hypothetical protein
MKDLATVSLGLGSVCQLLGMSSVVVAGVKSLLGSKDVQGRMKALSEMMIKT